MPSAETPGTPVKPLLAKAAESIPPLINGSPFVSEPSKASGVQEAATSSPPKARAPRNPGGLGIANGAHDGAEEQGQAESGTKKKPRRGHKKKQANAASSDPPQVMNSEVSRNGNDMNGSVKRGKGWRSTPLLQPSPQATSPAEKGAKKSDKRQRESGQDGQQNGWATEEATDIQDLGDFDFEANHKLFDKKTVFDQLRQGDTTADEDRLVSHNKVHARPGTYGGKNLHPTENVLSPSQGPKYNSNEIGSTSDADTELNFASGANANGRSSSRHSTSRANAAKKVPSRQNSAQVDGKPHPLTASMSSDRGMARSVTSLASRGGKPVPSILTASPKPGRMHSPQSATSTAKANVLPLPSIRGPALVLQPSYSVCPVLHPDALETLETATVSRYGLTHDAITESAARCIAEMAMSLFDEVGGSRRGSRANTLRGSATLGAASPPVVVVLAGNHALGARAVAAARHLVCRKIQIIVAEALIESAETQDAQMRTQTAMLRRMMRAGADIKRGPWRKAAGYIKSLTGPPTVIIDALLAGSTYESLLDSDTAEAQQEAREMIDWANRSRAPVLSVGCPSGVSGIDGSATVVEGEPLAVRPDKVISLGAPMQGVFEAMKNGERWEVSLADVGINIALRSDEAVAFGSHWVTELAFVEGEEEALDANGH